MKLRGLRPCPDGAEWLDTQSSLRSAWKNCTTPLWMIWYLYATVEHQAALALEYLYRDALSKTPTEDRDDFRANFANQIRLIFPSPPLRAKRR